MRKFLAGFVLVVVAMVVTGCGSSGSSPVTPAGTVYLMGDEINSRELYLSWGVTFSPLSFTLVNTSEEDVVVKDIPIGFESTNSALFIQTAREFSLRESPYLDVYGRADRATIGTGGAITAVFKGIVTIPKKGMKQFCLVNDVGIPFGWPAAATMSWRAFVAPGTIKAVGITSGREMKIEGDTVFGPIVRMDDGGKG